MADFEWRGFLQQWSRDLLASPLAAGLPDEVKQSQWAGFAPASEEQIAAAEKRLKIQLPPSYRDFLRVSNGWRNTTNFINRVRGTQEINWFRKTNRDWVDAYAGPMSWGDAGDISDNDYFGYGKFIQEFKPAHLKETLQISEEGDAAVYLLNPQVISKDGEWEAWFLANWLPGVHRYRSFLEMMQADYHQFARIEWKQPEGLIGELPAVYVGSPGSAKRRLKKKTIPRSPRVLGKRFDQWTVEELLSFLENPEYDFVRNEITYGLGLLKDRRALQPLLKLVKEGDDAAMYAVKEIAPEALAEPLLGVIRSRDSLSFLGAAMLLGELGEERALPILIEVLRDERQNQQIHANYVGQAIARFGEPGIEALSEATKSGSPIVRQRAVAGLTSTYDPRAKAVLKGLIRDPDPLVREIARSAIAAMPGGRMK